jgi:hypothetical protein
VSALPVPAQIAKCSCAPDDYRPCNGEFYRCEGCGAPSDDPMPYAEPMEGAGLDLTKATSWWFYCDECGRDWIKDGAHVVRVSGGKP